MESQRISVGDGRIQPRVAYNTELGTMFHGTFEQCFEEGCLDLWKGKVQLLFTSPPFPLNRKKEYGNLVGKEYIDWLASLAPVFTEMLTPNGSIVIEIGNAWQPGEAVMSTLSLEALLAFLSEGDLKLCQQFIAHNPAKLPGPAAWVTVKRIRVKDSFTHVWWMAKTDKPKSDNRRVLTPYKASMQRLLKTKNYNAGVRPSGHNINAKTFGKDHGGAIPSNVLAYPNTSSNDPYQEYCRTNGLTPHPARMHKGLAEFFVKFLSDPGDLVLDPFAGSNVTGSAAEELERCWISVEPIEEYVEGSRSRFEIIPS